MVDSKSLINNYYRQDNICRSTCGNFKTLFVIIEDNGTFDRVGNNNNCLTDPVKCDNLTYQIYLPTR